jgi:hypothetical protein
MRKPQIAVAAAAKGIKTGLPVVVLRNYALAGDGIVQATMDITHTEESRSNLDLVYQAIKTRFDSKLEAVAGSFTRLDHGRFTDRITGILSQVKTILPLPASGKLEGFRSISSNIFMDEERDMWHLRKTAAGQVLVRATDIGDDMSLLNFLDSKSSTSGGFRSSQDFRSLSSALQTLQDRIEGGKLVTYVTTDNKVRHGICVATVTTQVPAEALPQQPMVGQEQPTPQVSAEQVNYSQKLLEGALILPMDVSDPEIVSKPAVTVVHEATLPEVQLSPQERADYAMASARGFSAEDLIAYYRKLYGQHPEFFSRFEANIRKQMYC